MDQLNKKDHMDEEAKEILGRLRKKVRATLDLFLSNERSGTTSALKAALVQADAPIFLAGEEKHGKEVIKETDAVLDAINENEVNGRVVSWNSIRDEKTKGIKGQLITDNYFMQRALDSISSAFNFMFGELKRLKHQNDNLREANNNLAEANKRANQKLSKLKNRVDKLQEKLSKIQNGRS